MHPAERGSYNDFTKRIHNRAYPKRIPVDGSLELTLRCNLNCVHCYCRPPRGRQELSTEEACSIIDQVADAGCLWLLMTGGEPFLRKDFLEVYTHAKERGIIVSIFTNATLITPEIADYLQTWRPFVVEVSLYGVTKETYERVSGVQGSHERCLNGISLLLDRGIRVKLKSVLLTVNRHEIHEIERFAESMGVGFRFDPAITPALDGSREPLEVRLDPEDVISFDAGDGKREDAWRRMCKASWGTVESDKLYVCGAGKGSFHVDPYGTLYPCMLSRTSGYDLTAGSFKDGWFGFMSERVLSRKALTQYECRTCPIIALCGYCPGWSELECRNPESPVEFLCKLAHLRANKFGGQ